MVTANEQLMGTVSVSYLPAIQAAKQYSVSLEQLNAQLMNHQRLARQTGSVTAAGLASQFNNQKVILDQYGRTLVDLSQKTPGVTKGVDTITTAAAKQSKTVKELADQHGFLQHRMGWFISGTAFYGAIATAGKAYEAIKDVEMGMVEIARVTEDATADFNEMRTELLNLGIDYGRSWENVQDIALRWAQAGYNVNDTLELTKTALLALNTAELDARNSTESMIGIMAQWGMQVSELQLVIDKINKTADDYTVTSQDLVDGLLRSSMAAKNAGLSFDQAVAYLTVLREASGRTGREVGNAFNSILSMIRRTGSLKTFKDLEIEVFADEAAGKLKSIDTLFQAIAERWNTSGEAFQDAFVKATQDTELFSEELAIATGLQDDYNKALEEYSDIEKRDIAQSSAGIYRRNYFIALIENLAKVQGVLNNMTDAAGYSQRENARTMEALEMKVQSLRTAFTMLAMEIGEAGLLDVMKDAVDSTREMVQAFEQLPPELKQIIILLGEAAAVLGIVNLTAKTFFSVDLIKKITAYVTATRVATIATGGLSAAFYAMPLWGQIALLTTLGATIYSLATSAEDANKQISETIQKSIDAADKANAQADEIEKLTRKYENLTLEKNRTKEQDEQLEKVTRDLIDVMPGLASRFDEAKTAAEQYSGVIEYTTEQLARLRGEAKEGIKFAARVAADNVDNAKKEMDLLREKQIDVRAAYNVDDPISALNSLRRLYGERRKLIGDSFKIDSPFALFNPEEQKRIAKEILADWEKEINKNYLEAKEIYDNYQRTIDLGNRLDVAETFAPITGGATKVTETPAQAYERLNAERQLLNHQMKIGEISTAKYLASLKNIEQQMRAAGIEEKKIWSIQEEIASLQNKGGITLVDKAAELKKFYDEAYADAMAYYNHETAMARMSRDEQIQYLRDLTQQHEWELEKRWRLEEYLFRLYQDELKAQGDAIDKAYRDRMDKIDAERDAAITSIQVQIDALDALKESDDRSEAERKHNEKIAELQKERRYHELRTGAEHEEAILDINKKIEEENRDWQKQQEDWTLDDRKRSLQQQIEVIRKNAEEEKRIWQEKYESIKAQWNTFVTEFAQKATDDPRWLEIGKKIGQDIVDGFNQGKAGVQMPSIPSGGGPYVGGGSSGGTTYANPDGSVIPTTGQGYVDTSGYYHPSGGIPGIDTVFDRGGLAVGRGIMLKDTIEPEYVLSPQLTVSFQKLVAALQTNQIPQTQSRGGVIIYGSLLNAEKVELEDRQDMEIFSREMLRQVRKLM